MRYDKSEVIDGLITIHPDINYDFRGEYIETYNQTAHDHITGGVKFVIDDISVSRQRTMRGLHGDKKTIKLIQCLYGDVLQVIVDFRIQSPTFLQHQMIPLNDKNRTQVLVPAGCGNGHIVLSEKAISSYKQSEFYGGEGSQFQYAWSQFILDYDTWLPFRPKDAILSKRDANGMTLFEVVDWLNTDMSHDQIDEIVSEVKPEIVRDYARRRKNASY